MHGNISLLRAAISHVSYSSCRKGAYRRVIRHAKYPGCYLGYVYNFLRSSKLPVN